MVSKSLWLKWLAGHFDLEEERALVGAPEAGFPSDDTLGIFLSEGAGFDSGLVEIDEIFRGFNDGLGSFAEVILNREPLVWLAVEKAIDGDSSFGELVAA